MESYQAALADLDGMLGLAAGLAAIGICLWVYRRSWLIKPPAGIVIFAVAVLAGLVTIGAAPLDYDESFTALITRLDPVRIVQATAGDVHPPLYYLLIAALRPILGDSEAALRFPSLIFAGLAAWMAYRIARMHLREADARLVGVIVALLPGLVRYSHDARMYSLLAALLLAAMWGALSGRWRVYAFCMAGALYTHNYAGLYLVAFLPFWSRDRRGVAASALAIVLWLPWAVVGVSQQLAHVGAGFWIQPLTIPRLAEPFLMLGTGYSAPPALTILLLALAFGLTVAGAWYARQTRRGQYLMFAVGVPFLIAAVASVVFRPVYLPRGFIASMYLMPIMWVDWLRHQSWRGLALAAALAVGIVFVAFPASNQLDVRGFTEAAGFTSEDQVYHLEIGSYSLMGYYAPQADHYLMAYASDLSQTLTTDTKSVLGLQSAAFGDLPAGHRQFVVWCRTPFTTDQQLRTMHQLRETHQLNVQAIIDDGLRTFTIYSVVNKVDIRNGRR